MSKNETDVSSVLKKVFDEEKKISEVLENAKKKVYSIQRETSEELVVRKAKHEQALKQFRNELLLDLRKSNDLAVSGIVKKAEQDAKSLGSKSITPAQAEKLALSLFSD